MSTILVVEDDDHIAYLLEYLLTRESYTVWKAMDGRKAQAHLSATEKPDLVLLDVNLPYLDGFQLLGLIRDQPGWAGIPIVMLTSRAREEDIVKALDAGASDYLTKPFQPNELLARVRRLLGPRR